MKVVSLVGTRPQFIKLAPVAEAARRESEVHHVVIDTGQHYDAAMSSGLLDDFELPAPDYSLGIGSDSQPRQTAAMISALEGILSEEKPDWVMVYGDTTSTLAGALVTTQLGLRLSHLEAGLRSYNRSMPEERNRVVVDHLADLLLAPTDSAMANLQSEGLGSRTVVVGDVMADICLKVAASVDSIADELPAPPGQYVLATIHRPYNTDTPERLRSVIEALSKLPLPVFLAAHPRLASRATSYGLSLQRGAIQPIPPLVYSRMVLLAKNAAAIVTDSGGLQKEAYLLGTMCTTIRSETEWVETVATGWNSLLFDTGDLPSLASMALRDKPVGDRPTFYGTGDAAGEALRALKRG